MLYKLTLIGGSNPPLSATYKGGVTQLVECLLCKQNVIGSIPFASTLFLEQLMKLKAGQKVRVFGILKGSWVLGKVIDLREGYVTLIVQDWTGLSDSVYTLPYSNIEVISDFNT